MKKGLFLTALALSATLLAAQALPDYHEICKRLPTISGWQADECSGMKASGPMMGGEMVSAERHYGNGDESLDVTVVSGMQAMMMWAPYSSGFQMESDDQMMKVEKIDGFSVGIGYDKKEKSGGIVVQIAPNAVLAGNFENMDWKEALEVMKKIDWKSLAALFK
jgi:hypothetical protein